MIKLLYIFIFILSGCKGYLYVEFIGEKPEEIYFIDNKTSDKILVPLSGNILTFPIVEFGRFELIFKYAQTKLKMGYCHFAHSGNNYMTLELMDGGVYVNHYLVYPQFEYEKKYPEGLNKNDLSLDYGSVEFNERFNSSNKKIPYIIKESGPHPRSYDQNKIQVREFCTQSNFSEYYPYLNN